VPGLAGLDCLTATPGDDQAGQTNAENRKGSRFRYVVNPDTEIGAVEEVADSRISTGGRNGSIRKFDSVGRGDTGPDRKITRIEAPGSFAVGVLLGEQRRACGQIRDIELHRIVAQPAPMREAVTDHVAGLNTVCGLIQRAYRVGVQLDEIGTLVGRDALESRTPNLNLVIRLGRVPSTTRRDAGVVVVRITSIGLTVFEAWID